MLAGVYVPVFVAAVALTLSATPPAGGKAPAHRPAARHGAEGSPSKEPIRAEELYSLRARRRIAAYLRMRLLELRSERLDRAADAIERRLPVDVLVPR